MNYLAHLFLSGNNDALKVGNFIADGLKSKDKEKLPEDIMKGVNLHYKIDDFTDSHASFQKSVDRLFPEYGHYSRVIVDLFYDHFLGKNWTTYSNQPLQDFANDSLRILESYKEYLPLRSERFLGYIKKNNTLFEYSRIEGITLVLSHFSHRAKNESKIEKSSIELKLFYDDFDADFNSFFPEIIAFVKQQEEYN